MHLQKFFSHGLILFFLAIFSVPIFWMVHTPGSDQWSVIEKRKLGNFPSLSFQKFKTGVKRSLQFRFEEADNIFFHQFTRRIYQSTFERAVSDQFPFRMKFIKLAKAVDRFVIFTAYSGLPDTAIPADMSSGRYILPDKKMLIDEVHRFDPSCQSNIDNRIANYQELMDTHPDINFYIFYLDLLSNSPYHPVSKYYWNADLGQALNYFESHKPTNLKMGKMMISGFDDHEQSFYLTDHHLNVNGVLQAYDTIYKLLSSGYPEMSAPFKYDKLITFPGINFLGSAARVSYYPLEGEQFTVADFNLPPYTLLVNGTNESYNLSDEYLAGNYSNEPYLDHYAEYFGKQKAILEYTFENGSKRNLLIIGSSYKRPLQPLIASHYHHTYAVDLRSYKDFSLSTFLAKHPVQDILVLGENKIVFTDTIWTINP